MSNLNVLFVLSSHDTLGATGKKTGWYLPEFAHPYYEISPYANITVASPKGGKAPLDPSSIENFKSDEPSVKFLSEEESLWTNTVKIAEFKGKSGDFDAIFYVGGHGPVFDLAVDQDSIDLIREFYENGKIVSAVCHGPAVFVNVKLSNGEHLLKDQPATAFSNFEEDAIGLSDAIPFLTETKIFEAGGKYEKAAEAWQPHVAVGRGGKLITGQNPASAAPIAKEILKQLGVSA